MNLIDEIKCYEPKSLQEEKDKEMMLKYMEMYPNILYRENETVHFTSSAFVVNKKHDKVLMVYHNIYKSWSLTGGHADGEENLLAVAKREVEEETGVKNTKDILGGIATIDTLSCMGHFKKGKYVPAHIHLSVAYLFEADENEEIRIKEDENSNVGWLNISELMDLVNEEHMKGIYNKFVSILKSK